MEFGGVRPRGARRGRRTLEGIAFFNTRARAGGLLGLELGGGSFADEALSGLLRRGGGGGIGDICCGGTDWGIRRSHYGG